MIQARSIRILALLLLLTYLAIALAASWWTMSGPTGIVQRVDNLRRAPAPTAAAQPGGELQLSPDLLTPGA